MIGATTLQGPDSSTPSARRRVALTVLGHADAARVGDRVVIERRLELCRTEPSFEPALGGVARALDDPFLSRKPVIIECRGDGVEIDRAESPMDVSIDGSELGGNVVLGPSQLERGVVLCLGRSVALLVHWVRSELSGVRAGYADHSLIGVSDAVVELRGEIERVAKADVPVLILGESGVGKERVARAIHAGSARASGPFEAVNMAAIPPGVAASELFGHEKGAFTGAERAHTGSFVRADRGSLFLDELGDTHAEVQPLLLRALQTGEVQPLGARRAVKVDVRWLAATDVDLEEAIERGSFRASLLHRLAGYRLAVAPLRQRRDDIGVLFYWFLRRELGELGITRLLDAHPKRRAWLSASAVARLVQHDFPGNVRELENVARQLVISRHREPHVTREDVERLLGRDRPLSAAPRGAASAPLPALDSGKPAPSYRDPSDVSDDELLAQLRAHAFSVGPTAKALGISRTSLYALVERNPRVRKASELSLEEIDAALGRSGGRLAEAAAMLEVSAHALKLRKAALAR